MRQAEELPLRWRPSEPERPSGFIDNSPCSFQEKTGRGRQPCARRGESHGGNPTAAPGSPGAGPTCSPPPQQGRPSSTGWGATGQVAQGSGRAGNGTRAPRLRQHALEQPTGSASALLGSTKILLKEQRVLFVFSFIKLAVILKKEVNCCEYICTLNPYYPILVNAFPGLENICLYVSEEQCSNTLQKQ